MLVNIIQIILQFLPTFDISYIILIIYYYVTRSKCIRIYPRFILMKYFQDKEENTNKS